jgi:major membrane immunogen (membrane-anchored lipoprotein)
MKHLRITSALLLLLATVFIVSCSKKDEPEPTLADQVAGDYTINKIGVSGFSLDVPYTDPTNGTVTSGTIKVVKVTDDTATAKMTLSEKDKSGKITDDISDLGTATLKKATTGEIEAYSGTIKIGTYSNGVLSLLGTSPDLGNITISGKKN